MIRAFALVFLGILPSSLLAAEAVRIRSGEHTDFSRLVFELPESIAWTLGRTAAGYDIRFGDLDLAFDTSDIYKYMPRTRILDVASTGKEFRLTVDCDCHADAFEYRPGMLVVDIKDGLPPVHSRFETAFSGDETLATTDGPEIQSDQEGAHPDLPLPASPAPPKPKSRLIEVETPSGLRLPQPPAVSTRTDNVGEGTSRSDLRSTLAEGMARALSQGLVELSEPAEDSQSDVVRSPEPVMDNLSPQPSIKIRTAFDRPVAAASAENADSRCRPAEWFALGPVPEMSSPLEAVAAGRIKLADERQSEGERSVASLARAYLALGFGAEAAQLLHIYDYSGPDSDVLLAMAQIVDEPGQAVIPDLQDESDCDTPGALWGFLAFGSQKLTDDLNEKALLGGFAALPKGLRHHLAAGLSQRLREAHHPKAAFTVREAVIRTAESVSPSMRLEADRAGRNAQGSAVSEVLTSLARSADETESAALADILQISASNGERPDASTISDAEALIHESRGTAAGNFLFESYIAAMVEAGEYARALAEVDRLAVSEFAGKYELDDARAKIFTALAHEATAGKFVSMMAAVHPQELPEMVEPALSRRIVDRFLALGFPDEAERFRPAAGAPDVAAGSLAAQNFSGPGGMAHAPSAGIDQGSRQITRASTDILPNGADPDPGSAQIRLQASGRPSRSVVEESAPLSATRDLIQESEDLRQRIASLLGDN